MWRMPCLLCVCNCGYRTCTPSPSCSPSFSENRLTFIALCQSDLFSAIGASNLIHLKLNWFFSILSSYILHFFFLPDSLIYHLLLELHMSIYSMSQIKLFIFHFTHPNMPEPSTPTFYTLIIGNTVCNLSICLFVWLSL